MTDTLLPTPATAGRAAPARALARVDIVVPVYNEQASLEDSIRRLHGFLSDELPYAWRIVIADNASTDSTLAVARALAVQLEHTIVVHLDAKGRGRALRAAWNASDADVLCYMDVDLSTDLRALLPLISPLVSGHSQVAIGSRLASGSHVVRGFKREVISRCYNRLLRYALRARFSDAQCGFKAIRADAARRLLPEVEDQGWFFDTELLVCAQRHGMRIHEVPVDWVDDADSRVDIVSTALTDLRGVVRLGFAMPLVRFLAIGVLSTLAYALLYVVFRGWLGAGGANALALALTAVANTQANRRYTFGVRGRPGLVRQHLAGGLVYLIALGLTAAALAVLQGLDPHPGSLLEVVVLVAASTVATATRYVALRTLVFARARRAALAVRAIPR
ncbi:MAG TPA: dolichyl-phosphate beta-glucosyltransferase [Solirubrobacteraceae bacterium]|jgi:glycosyltransferase involved in cell wall biosynthesis|nr:dolichyl-phosphate beta-glucosyltransferase [Solirubrobacteraceae bacterium]